MKKKNLIIFIFLITFLSIGLIAKDVQAIPTVGGGIQAISDNVKLKYKPNVPIDITVGDYNFADEIVIDEGGDFLASYIVAIYKLGASFAGIIAMLMLVIAGWKWLLAGGNAQKVTEAKNMISGVFIGLALLFGGQLLLTQISSDFDSIQSLSVRLPDAALESITLSEAQTEECERLEDQGGKCEVYATATSCYSDVCSFGRTGNPDDICVPGEYIRNNQSKISLLAINFEECFDCPDFCTRDFNYVDNTIRLEDPCECDR